MSESALNELSLKIITSLRKNSIFFRQQQELIRNGATANELNEKSMKMMTEMRQHILSTVQFFADSYLNGNTSFKFILNLFLQLLDSSVCENDIAIECVYILFSSTFPKLVCEQYIHKALRAILTTLQSTVHHSEVYSMPIKKLVRNLISMAIHRFGFDIQLYTEQKIGALFTQHDLDVLRREHQEAFNNLDI